MFNKEYYIYGKHAEYVMALSKDKSITEKADTGNNVFRFSFQVVLLAALCGVYNNMKSEQDTNPEIETRKIARETVLKYQDDFKYIYQLVMISNKEITDVNKKIELAFKADVDENIEKEGMTIFDSYVRGGIEYLYDKFFVNVAVKGNKFEAMKEFIKEIKMQNDDAQEIINEIM